MFPIRPILAAVVLAVCTCSAQDSIGFVDMERIFQEFYKTVKEEIKLQKQMDVYKQYAVALESSIGELQREANKARDESLNLALKPEIRAEKQAEARQKFMELQDKKRELREYQNDKKRGLRERYEETRALLVAEIADIVQQEAKARKLRLVLDSSGKTLNGIPAFVYFEPEMDFTDAVVEILNRGHHAELEELREQSKELDSRGGFGVGN
ncbi:MAG TPA: hypothetical protein DCR55_16735 [Lentisphaeria bacterium]|nr:hypothetical protein [Lentisphaeria bacterium]